MSMGVDIKHDRLSNLVDDTAAIPILHRHIEVVASRPSDGDIVFFIGLGEKSIECQVKETLRDASIGQANLWLERG